ncbi:MAG: hypothetical protein AMXMBFR84_12670 [Candidatus Hydrogenedentota bacterium]
MNRREFLAATAATGITISHAMAVPQTEGAEGEMKYRILGRTGERVSLLGLGGYHIGVPDEAEGISIIHAAIDAGINFMDNSWDYHAGGSEERMGKALKGPLRDKVFLMTKIDGRTKASAESQLNDCLRRLQTDRIDLLQHHEMIRMDDGDRIFAEGGAMEALYAAKEAGKIRYIGFTGHKDPAVHLRMIEVADANGFTFDTVQMPLNVLDAHFRSFRDGVLPVLVERGIGVLGMKSVAGGVALETNAVTVQECLHYAMTLPTSVVISGMQTMAHFEQNLETVRNFKPMTETETAALLSRTVQFAKSGKFERFKTTPAYDATAYHPEWLG